MSLSRSWWNDSYCTIYPKGVGSNICFNKVGGTPYNAWGFGGLLLITMYPHQPRPPSREPIPHVIVRLSFSFIWEVTHFVKGWDAWPTNQPWGLQHRSLGIVDWLLVVREKYGLSEKRGAIRAWLMRSRPREPCRIIYLMCENWGNAIEEVVEASGTNGVT